MNYSARNEFLTELNVLGSVADNGIRQLPYGTKWQERARQTALRLRKHLRELEMLLEQEAKESFNERNR